MFGLFEGFNDIVGQRIDMPIRPAGRDDHEVSHRRFAANIDADGILG